MVRQNGELPHSLEDGEQLIRDLGGRWPTVFLDYDGTLTPIVDRPEDALISEGMRNAVRELAGRCPVCVVSGRDRRGGAGTVWGGRLIGSPRPGVDIRGPPGGGGQAAGGGGVGGSARGVGGRT